MIIPPASRRNSEKTTAYTGGIAGGSPGQSWKQELNGYEAVFPKNTKKMKKLYFLAELRASPLRQV
jgi:hypothetical protein